jgi:hypothetical protein
MYLVRKLIIEFGEKLRMLHNISTLSVCIRIIARR